MCMQVLFVVGRGLGRERCGVEGSVRSGVCVGMLAVGKRAIVCVGS